jgi:Flp pilus assembly protein TadD
VPGIGDPAPEKTIEKPDPPQPEKPLLPVPPKEPRPAILDTMIRKAENQLFLHRPDTAFQTLERALAIDGRDPEVWHLMAKAQLMNGQYRQAESLARKSNSLAGDDRSLKKKNWKIIIRALEEQGRVDEADQAREKAGA